MVLKTISIGQKKNHKYFERKRMKRVLVYAVCDYDRLPNGGEVMLLNSFLSANHSDKIKYYLVGMSFNKKDKVGIWQKKKIGETNYAFFPVTQVLKDKEKTIIPFRLRVMVGIRKYWSAINSVEADYHYIHEAELAIPMWKKDIKIVYHGHGDPCQTLRISRFPLFRGEIFTKAYWRVISRTLKKSNKIIWAADRSKKLYIEQQPFMKEIVERKSCTIHSSFDTKLVVDPSRLKLVSRKHLITVGRLSRVKRIDFLLFVTKEIINRGWDIDFIICGDGEEMTSLKLLAEKLDIKDRVLFLGLCDRELIATALSQSDVFMFASENEAMSLVVLESLYMGTPVVSTDVGDIPYAVKDGITGYIVYEYDINKFADYVIHVLETGKQSYLSNCKSMAKDFSPEKMAGSINEVFNEEENKAE